MPLDRGGRFIEAGRQVNNYKGSYRKQIPVASFRGTLTEEHEQTETEQKTNAQNQVLLMLRTIGGEAINFKAPSYIWPSYSWNPLEK